jgi:hypothetical protein
MVSTWNKRQRQMVSNLWTGFGTEVCSRPTASDYNQTFSEKLTIDQEKEIF